MINGVFGRLIIWLKRATGIKYNPPGKQTELIVRSAEELKGAALDFRFELQRLEQRLQKRR